MIADTGIWFSEHIVLPIVLIILSKQNLSLPIRRNAPKYQTKENNMIKDLQLVVAALQDVLIFIEKVDSNAANNPIVADIQKVLDFLKSL